MSDQFIEEFLGRYTKEFSFYEQLCSLAESRLRELLTDQGIRCIVSSRAKSYARLPDKLSRLQVERQFENIDDIYHRMTDLAGIRIATYFPNDRMRVQQVLKTHFDEARPDKHFPQPDRNLSTISASSEEPDYSRTFSGYHALHCYIALRSDGLRSGQTHYCGHCIEVQIASVLMHSWSEVEHDLAYKQLNGILSYEESALLDQINGLVLAGEIALNQLQRAIDARTGRSDAAFGNHFELASFILEHLSSRHSGDTSPYIGRADLLLMGLQLKEIDFPKDLVPYLDQVNLDIDSETNSVSNQIMSRIFADDPSRLEAINYLQSKNLIQNPYVHRATQEQQEQSKEAINFLRKWRELQSFALRLSRKFQTSYRGTLPAQLRDAPEFGPDLYERYESLQRFQPGLLRQDTLPSANWLRASTSELDAMIASVRAILDRDDK